MHRALIFSGYQWIELVSLLLGQNAQNLFCRPRVIFLSERSSRKNNKEKTDKCSALVIF